MALENDKTKSAKIDYKKLADATDRARDEFRLATEAFVAAGERLKAAMDLFEGLKEGSSE